MHVVAMHCALCTLCSATHEVYLALHVYHASSYRSLVLSDWVHGTHEAPMCYEFLSPM